MAFVFLCLTFYLASYPPDSSMLLQMAIFHCLFLWVRSIPFICSNSPLTGVIWYVIVALVCNSLKMSDIKHIFICLLAICMFSLKNVYFEPLSIFNRVIFLLLLLSCMSRGLNLKDYIHSRGGADTRRLTQKKTNIYWLPTIYRMLCKYFKLLYMIFDEQITSLFYRTWGSKRWSNLRPFKGLTSIQNFCKVGLQNLSSF